MHNLFADPEKLRFIVQMIFSMVVVGGSIMGLAVSSDRRATQVKSALAFIICAIVVLAGGLMFIDYLWYPENQAIPADLFAKQWINDKISII